MLIELAAITDIKPRSSYPIRAYKKKTGQVFIEDNFLLNMNKCQIWIEFYLLIILQPYFLIRCSDPA